jgi:hypothetical protein
MPRGGWSVVTAAGRQRNVVARLDCSVARIELLSAAGLLSD